MSMDRSLKSASSLVRHRNVLTRGERLLKLQEVSKWDESKSPLGLVKVGHRKVALAKPKAEAVEGEAAAAGAAAPAAPAAKGAPAGKAAAPAAAKAAAPAAGKAAGGKKK